MGSMGQQKKLDNPSGSRSQKEKTDIWNEEKYRRNNIGK